MLTDRAAFQSVAGQRHPRSVAQAKFIVTALLIVAVVTFAAYIVGTRPIDVGSDTQSYAAFLQSVASGDLDTRFNIGFVLLTRFAAFIGCDVVGYQVLLFCTLLLFVGFAAREFWRYIGQRHGATLFLTATLVTLLLSPVFVEASTNIIRQGLAAPIVFVALLEFQRRRWLRFALFGAVATSFHWTTLLYLASALILVVPRRGQRVIAVTAFALYCTGASRLIVERLFPSAYAIVMQYGLGVSYHSGVRLDFAAFSICVYLLLLLGTRFVTAQKKATVRDMSSLYLALTMPFFVLGWGDFSDRFLFPAWLYASIMLSAVVCTSRLRVSRSVPAWALMSCLACLLFYLYVANNVTV